MILSVVALVNRITKHGVEAGDRIMKHGMVVKEARSNL
jgi:hypothetical protein